MFTLSAKTFLRRLNGQSGMCFQSVCEALATVLSPLCKLQTFTRSPAGLPNYRSHFNNNSFYPQVCLTLSLSTVLIPSQHTTILCLSCNNMSGKLNCRTAKYLLDYLQSMDESWSIITCFWKSHDSDPSINIYMLINILVPRSTYICWFENLWTGVIHSVLKHCSQMEVKYIIEGGGIAA